MTVFKAFALAEADELPVKDFFFLILSSNKWQELD